MKSYYVYPLASGKRDPRINALLNLHIMKFKTIFNEEIDCPCMGCVVADNTKFKQGRIYQSALWDLSQDFEIAHPGMVVLSPMRHVSSYADLTPDELKELSNLTIHCKKAIKKIFSCEDVSFSFYEKKDGHVHFVIIPLAGIKDKYSVLRELMSKAEYLRTDKENMIRVVKAIDDFREYFKAL